MGPVARDPYRKARAGAGNPFGAAIQIAGVCGIFSYLAIYVLDHRDVLQSEGYRSVGGPSTAFSWHSRLRN
jgi:hypothetical protein